MNHRFVVAVEELNDNSEIVANHFGHCSKFVVCEVDEEKQLIKKEIYFNPISGNHGGTCQLPAYIKQFDVSTIIAGGIGRKAINNFQEYGIDVITAPGLKFDTAFHAYIEGNLTGYIECSEQNKHHHHNHNSVCRGHHHN